VHNLIAIFKWPANDFLHLSIAQQTFIKVRITINLWQLPLTSCAEEKIDWVVVKTPADPPFFCTVFHLLSEPFKQAFHILANSLDSLFVLGSVS